MLAAAALCTIGAMITPAAGSPGGLGGDAVRSSSVTDTPEFTALLDALVAQAAQEVATELPDQAAVQAGPATAVATVITPTAAAAPAALAARLVAQPVNICAALVTSHLPITARSKEGQPNAIHYTRNFQRCSQGTVF